MERHCRNNRSGGRLRTGSVTANNGQRCPIRTRADDPDHRPSHSLLLGREHRLHGAQASLSDDENVLGLTLLDDFDDRALFRIEWPSDINGLVGSIKAHGATILDAAGTNERWDFQLRFPNSADISDFHADCNREGIHLDLRRLYRPDQSDLETSGLTPTQRETLLTALEEGYFSIPRRITGEELAARLGVSDQAVSERLRRAQTTVFTSLLLANDTNADDD